MNSTSVAISYTLSATRKFLADLSELTLSLPAVRVYSSCIESLATLQAKDLPSVRGENRFPPPSGGSLVWVHQILGVIPNLELG